MTGTVYTFDSGKVLKDVPRNYYCEWTVTLEEKFVYVVFVKRDWPPQVVLEMELWSPSGHLSRVYDWQLRDKNLREDYD